MPIQKAVINKAIVQTLSAQIPWSHSVLIHQIESDLYGRQVLNDKVSNLGNRLAKPLERACCPDDERPVYF